MKTIDTTISATIAGATAGIWIYVLSTLPALAG